MEAVGTEISHEIKKMEKDKKIELVIKRKIKTIYEEEIIGDRDIYKLRDEKEEVEELIISMENDEVRLVVDNDDGLFNYPVLLSKEEILQRFNKLNKKDEEAVEEFLDWIWDNKFDENKAIDYIAKHSEIQDGEVTEIDYPDAWSGGGIYVTYEGYVAENVRKIERWFIGYVRVIHAPYNLETIYTDKPKLVGYEYYNKQ